MKKDSWLYSDSFLKRAFAIWGHYIVANLIIGAAVFILISVFTMVFGFTIASRFSHMQPSFMNSNPWMDVESTIEMN